MAMGESANDTVFSGALTLAAPIQCAVQRCTTSVGANPTRQQSFQPVAIGTAVEVTNRSKLLVQRVRKGLGERTGRNVQ